jgi:DNA-binding NarL/FixJ family response regulator
MRKAAGLPPLPAERAQQQLDPARGMGMEAFSRLWEQGLEMSPDAAVALALSSGPQAARVPGAACPPPRVSPAAGLSALPSLAPQSTLTPREREITALIAHGHSNKAIADELVISPATAARHVANILAKLGFTSRAQIAAWAAGNGSIQPSAAHERDSVIR